MATEFHPGVFTAVFDKLAISARASGAAALTHLALAIERQTKTDLALTTHKRGTKTPASRGGPPALVSGTLRRSVTHTRPVPWEMGMEVRVGLARGFYPPYPKKGKKTQSSKYGYYLETAKDYPFLEPAYRKVLASGIGAQLGRIVAEGWTKA